MVSIIIPIYKAEKLIRRCLDSVLAQSYTDWECILVDDGSPDASGIICDEYCKNDERFVVIHKANGGVSSARNCGIEKAQGDYITFLDADDWYKEGFLQDMITSEADVVACGFDCTEAQSYTLSPKYYSKNDISQNAEMLMYCSAFWTPWGKLFKAYLFKEKGVRFDKKLRLGEDTCFNWEILSIINSIEFIAPCNYQYEGNPADLSKYKLSWDEIIELESALIHNMKKVEMHVGRVFRKHKSKLLSRLGCAKDFYNNHSDIEVFDLFQSLLPDLTYIEYIRYCITEAYIIQLSNMFRKANCYRGFSIDYPLSCYLKAGPQYFLIAAAMKSKLKGFVFADVLAFLSLAWNSFKVRYIDK